jgi:hypothetical protein
MIASRVTFIVARDDNPSSWKTSRRLSIQSKIIHQFISSNTSGTSYAHSFLSFFGEQSGPKFQEIHWKWVCNNFKMLRVLHLELVGYSVPQEIETLIHLRYLKIKFFDIMGDVLVSIGNEPYESRNTCHNHNRCFCYDTFARLDNEAVAFKEFVWECEFT